MKTIEITREAWEQLRSLSPHSKGWPKPDVNGDFVIVPVDNVVFERIVKLQQEEGKSISELIVEHAGRLWS